MPSPFDTGDLSKGLETLLGRAADVLTKGREEILRQSRIGKVKLFDLTQLRRERARLVMRLGEEAYRAMQAGKLGKDDLQKSYDKIVRMDEEIAAKEAEIEDIRREEDGRPAKTAASKSSPKAEAREVKDDAAKKDKTADGKTGSAKTAKKRPPMDTRPRRSLGNDDDEDE